MLVSRFNRLVLLMFMMLGGKSWAQDPNNTINVEESLLTGGDIISEGLNNLRVEGDFLWLAKSIVHKQDPVYWGQGNV